jgi:hypothetical protein
MEMELKADHEGGDDELILFVTYCRPHHHPPESSTDTRPLPRRWVVDALRSRFPLHIDVRSGPGKICRATVIFVYIFNDTPVESPRTPEVAMASTRHQRRLDPIRRAIRFPAGGYRPDARDGKGRGRRGKTRGRGGDE